MRGRPRKPVHELIDAGTFRQDRHGNLDEQWQPDGAPEKPEWLDSEAGELWDDLVPQLTKRGIATAVDASELAALCDWWGRYRSIAGRLVDHADIESKEYYRLSILAGMSWKNFASAAAKFGLNPSDRARLKLETTKGPDELLTFTNDTGTVDTQRG